MRRASTAWNVSIDTFDKKEVDVLDPDRDRHGPPPDASGVGRIPGRHNRPTV